MNEKDIQNILCSHYIQERIVIPNVYLFMWESDLIIVRKTGYIHEFEIKCSRSDYKNDFNKKIKHQILEYGKFGFIDAFVKEKIENEVEKRPNKFSFVCPEGMIKPDEIPNYCGLIYIKNLYSASNWSYCDEIAKAKFLHKNKYDYNKILLEKVCSKYWNMRRNKKTS